MISGCSPSRFVFVGAFLGLAFLVMAAEAASEWENALMKGVKPLAELPPHVGPEPGKVSLYADFAHKEDHGITVYLINDTKKDLAVPTQDGDMYSKRQVKDEDGEWRRCDTHQYSWCGNSYIPYPLPAGKFRSWVAKVDTPGGKERPLRFKMHQKAPWDLVSNEGVGRVDDGEIFKCRYDTMAMRQGPFEDVAAVATGKVKAVELWGGGVAGAISALDRFAEDERLVPVMQGALAALSKEPTPAPGYEHVYQSGLRTLTKAMEKHGDSHDNWTYVRGHMNDRQFPWRNEALDWLIQQYALDKERIMPVVEEVLAEPGHPAMRAAIFGYATVVDRAQAALKLESIAADKRYAGDERLMAHQAREGLFVNPFLSITVEAAQGTGDGLVPLRSVKFTNISPQAITLHAGKPEGLLVVRVVTDDGKEVPMKRQDAGSGGALSLKPGGQIEIKDVKWWEYLDTGVVVERDSTYSVSFEARSPGLWDVTAKSSWSWGIKGAALLGEAHGAAR